METVAWFLAVPFLILPVVCLAQEAGDSPLAKVDARVLTADEAAGAPGMVRAEISVRTRRANEREDAAWAKVASWADWEKFRDARLDALRRSLGGSLAWVGQPAHTPRFEVTGAVPGEGFRIQNLVIAGRVAQPPPTVNRPVTAPADDFGPFPITANLYLPDPLPKAPMPGVLICSSHHNPKTQGELLDMGMTWARAGAMVLVMDNIGYAERRQQPYGGREDYRWRYYLGMQLYAIGQSLIGWIVDDLRSGIDVLLAQPGADPKRIIAMGAVAGGGDPVAVLGAFDARIGCVIPFNFGSSSLEKPTTQGETEWMDFVGGGDFETTRCLRNSARDGFLPWVIVGAAAPRYLIFAKEFDWDAARDAGFARIGRVYGFSSAKDKLDSIHGYGNGSQSATQASHANNVGPPHRKQIYPILERWLAMPVPESYKTRPKVESLTCITPEVAAKFPQRKVHEVLAEEAVARVAAARAALAKLSPEARRDKLRTDFARLLGHAEPPGLVVVRRDEKEVVGSISVARILLEPEKGVLVPVLLLRPAGKQGKLPVVVCVGQQGKAKFLAKRAKEIDDLLSGGVAVALVDVRGTGETVTPGGRIWYLPPVEAAAEELMLGRTMLGSRLSDLRAVLRYLKTRPDVDGQRAAVWGESFAGVNPPDFVDPPMMTKQDPELAEPLGAQLAILAAVYEDNVKAVLARGGLVSFATILDNAACHVVLDGIVPQVTEVGDLCDLVATLPPCRVRIEGAVDGKNRVVPEERLMVSYMKADGLQLSPALSADAAKWLAESLRSE